MIYCKDCLNDGNCINPGYYKSTLRSECFRDKNGEKLKPSVAEILNSQPIQKAPSFQMTEEEAGEIIKHVCIRASVNYKWIEIVDVDTTISELRKAGLIRKSPLVELVEEAEELWSACYRNTELEPSNLNAKLHQALQALKKIIKSSEVRNDNSERKIL